MCDQSHRVDERRTCRNVVVHLPRPPEHVSELDVRAAAEFGVGGSLRLRSKLEDPIEPRIIGMTSRILLLSGEDLAWRFRQHDC